MTLLSITGPPTELFARSWLSSSFSCLTHPPDGAVTSGQPTAVAAFHAKQLLTIFYSPTLVAQQKERQIDEKLGNT